MKKITKRDVFFFFFGIFLMLIIDAVLNWNDSNKALKTGSEAFMKKAERNN